MIHFIDKSNRRLYLEQLQSMTEFIVEQPEAWMSTTADYPTKSSPLDERFDFAIRLHEDGAIAECLQTCHLKDAASLGLSPESALRGVGRGHWVFDPIRVTSAGAPEPLHTSARLWVGLLESIARGADRRLVTRIDQWRFAMAVKAGMPWRKFADLDDRYLLAVMDLDKVMVRRLAHQFGLPSPCAYRVERADIQTWGTLRRVEQEFAALSRVLGSRPGPSHALHG